MPALDFEKVQRIAEYGVIDPQVDQDTGGDEQDRPGLIQGETVLAPLPPRLTREQCGEQGAVDARERGEQAEQGQGQDGGRGGVRRSLGGATSAIGGGGQVRALDVGRDRLGVDRNLTEGPCLLAVLVLVLCMRRLWNLTLVPVIGPMILVRSLRVPTVISAAKLMIRIATILIT